jgi:hypothetical protein
MSLPMTLLTCCGLVACILASASAHTAELRFRAMMIGVGEKRPENLNQRYDQWRNLLATQVKQLISAALSDLKTDQDARYLRDFDIEFRDEPKTLTLSERERRWRENKLLQLTEAIPVTAAGNEFRMHGTVYLGSLKGPLRTDSILLNETMKVEATRASSEALVLITLFTLVENAIETGRPTFVICALIGQANSFAKDVEVYIKRRSTDKSSLKEVLMLLEPALAQRRTEQLCRATN